MKFDQNKAFPYPVLRPHSDDYLDAEFQASADFKLRTSEIEVLLTYVISCEEILHEIHEGNAEFVSLVSCRDTYYRTAIHSSNNTASKLFDAGELKGEITVDSYVVATKDLNKFSSADINPEFASSYFDFKCGDVLAQDDTQNIYIDRELFKPVHSLFELVKDESVEKGDWKLSIDQNYIHIRVHPKSKELIDNVRNDESKIAVLVNSIYFAAAQHIVSIVIDNYEEYSDYTWAEVIKKQLHNMGDPNEDPYFLTQKLMKSPYKTLESYFLEN